MAMAKADSGGGGIRKPDLPQLNARCWIAQVGDYIAWDWLRKGAIACPLHPLLALHRPAMSNMSRVDRTIALSAIAIRTLSLNTL
jgi:hypothetical protein